MNNGLIIIKATYETLIMLLVSGGMSFLIGIPLGIILFLTAPGKLMQQKMLHLILGLLINIGRSIPFVILMVTIIPVTRWITGTSIGTIATLVPLTVSAIPFVARLTEGAMEEISPELIEVAESMGATSLQIIWKVLLPEALPSLIHGATITLITLVSYTAIAGTIGGGGLGSVAINYGYQRFNASIMLQTVIILIILVQIIQWAGNKIKYYYSHYE